MAGKYVESPSDCENVGADLTFTPSTVGSQFTLFDHLSIKDESDVFHLTPCQSIMFDAEGMVDEDYFTFERILFSPGFVPHGGSCDRNGEFCRGVPIKHESILNHAQYHIGVDEHVTVFTLPGYYRVKATNSITSAANPSMVGRTSLYGTILGNDCLNHLPSSLIIGNN